MAERDKFSDFDNDLPSGPEITRPKQEEAPDEVKQLRDELKQAREQREEAIRAMLHNSGTQAPAEENTNQEPASYSDYIKSRLPDDVDEDVLSVLEPVLEAQKEFTERDMISRFGPAVSAINRQEVVKEMTRRVPGFTEDTMSEVERVHSTLPAHEQADYDTIPGVEAVTMFRRVQLKVAKSIRQEP